MKNQKETKKEISRYIPSLSLQYQFLLYFVTIICIVLALLQVALTCFPFLAGIVCYVLAAITLTISSYYIIIYIRQDIREVIKPAITANPYTNKVTTDYRWRTILFAASGMVSNIVFAIFNGIIGIISCSTWFGTLAAYYILLSIMRIGVVRQERKLANVKEKQERMRQELSVYRMNSILFIFMAGVLAGMVILLLNAQGGKDYSELMIYAVATYTFYKIITSTIEVIRVEKRKSPLLSIIKRIGYIDACVSILTLQTAMFTTFAEREDSLIKLMNGLTGTIVCIIVLGLGIQGLCLAKKSN